MANLGNTIVNGVLRVNGHLEALGTNSISGMDNSKLPLAGGTMTGHIYLGGVAQTSTDSAADIVFGTSSAVYAVIKANKNKAIVFSGSITDNTGAIAYSANSTQPWFGPADTTNKIVDLGRSSNAWKDLYVATAYVDNITFNNVATGRTGVQGVVGNNDYWFYGGGVDAADAGYAEIATGDGGNEPIYVRQYSQYSPLSENRVLKRSATLLDANGNTTFPGNVTMSNATISGTVHITNNTDAVGTADNNAALIIGSRTGNHIVIDNNEIMSKSTSTTTNSLVLNNDGGNVVVGGNLTPVKTNTTTLGTSDLKWSNVYATTFTGNLSGTANVASKLGTANVGSAIRPIYLAAGVATACNQVASGSYKDAIPYIGTDGVMEIGSHIDFHTTTSTSDFNARICLDSSNRFQVTASIIPSTTTLTLGTSDTKWSNVYATTFTGALSGNATTATTASKVTGNLTNPTTKTSYFIPFYSDEATGGKTIRQNNGIRYNTIEGTTSDVGEAVLILGNGVASGTAGNKCGAIQIASTNAGTIVLKAAEATATKTIYLPAADGTIALTTSNVASATKLAAAKTIKLDGIVSGSTTFDGSADKTITTTISGFSTVQTITKSMKLTTSWQDTGITMSNITAGDGSYIVQVFINSADATGYYTEYWTGIMSVFKSNINNSTDSDEIVLHKNGHASNGNTIFLRTLRQSGSSATSKLQIADTHAWTAAASIQFKFRRLI